MKIIWQSLGGVAIAALSMTSFAEISGSGTPNAACASGQIGGALKQSAGNNPGIGGATLHLANDEDVYVAVTDADGKYLFFGLCEGDYELLIVSESIPAQLTLADASLGRDDGEDFDGDLDQGWEIELKDDTEQLLNVNFTFDGEVSARCQLSLDAGCSVALLPTDVYECSKRVSELSMRWNGSQDIRVIAHNGKHDDEILADRDFVSPGDRVTVNGMIDPPDDVIWEVFAAGSDTKLGESKFHMACDDEEMDGPDDCGLPQGDGKDNKPERINDWTFDGLADASGRISCAEPAFSNVCEFEPVRADCDLVDEVIALTFIYTGGDCASSNNDQPDKFECDGNINSAEPLLITPKDEASFTVLPGGVFSIPKDGSDAEFELSNSGGTQSLKIHTSCSKPLAAGDTYGNLTLGAINGFGIVTPVDFRYHVTNSGDAAAGVLSIGDTVAPPYEPGESLGAQSATTLYGSAWIRDTMTNTVNVAGDSTDSGCAASDLTTTVVRALPACNVAEIARELHDKEIRWQVQAGTLASATIESVEIAWPVEIAGKLKEMLLDGDKFFDTDITSENFIVDAGNVQGELEDRRVRRDETRTLKIKFDDDIEDTPAEFSITVNFEEGCSISW